MIGNGSPAMSSDTQSITNMCALTNNTAVIMGTISEEVSGEVFLFPTLRHSDSAPLSDLPSY